MAITNPSQKGQSATVEPDSGLLQSYWADARIAAYFVRSKYETYTESRLLLGSNDCNSCQQGMPNPLKFRFELDKFVNAVAFLANAGKGDLTKLKAVKLLYLADQQHLLKYGRPITGDTYVAMEYGPVPEGSFQIISRMEVPDEIEDDPVQRRALKYLSVYKGTFNRYRYPVLRARLKPNLDVFSDSEIETLCDISKHYGHWRARDLVDLTHKHQAYIIANAGRAPGSSVPLPYEYFFEDADPEQVHRIRELAESQQEDRDFADALRKAGRAALTSKHRAVAVG